MDPDIDFEAPRAIMLLKYRVEGAAPLSST
jgi:hypothetical protein